MNITVVGSHRIAMTPERATLHLTVGCEADDMRAALQGATNTVSELRTELEALKAAAPSPTTWFAVLPVQTRAWTPWNQDGIVMPVRYSATVKIKVEFRDFPALARFAADYGSAEFVTMEYVEWTLTDTTKADAERRVLAGAVKDATLRATHVAHAVGATNLEALEVADPGLLSGIAPGGSVDSQYQSHELRAASGRDSEGIDLVPEDIEIEAGVDARLAARL